MTLTLQILKVKTSINLIPVSDSKKNTESENLVITISHFQYYQTIIFRLGGKMQLQSVRRAQFIQVHFQGVLGICRWIISSLVTICRASQPGQTVLQLLCVMLPSLVSQLHGYHIQGFLAWLDSSLVTIHGVS